MAGFTIERNVKRVCVMDQSTEYLNGNREGMLKKIVVKNADSKANTLNSSMYIT
tara:strand:+ start:143 stop:304 length:162 start_codon:yes stop_codon:yes gene_type:complete